MKNKTANTKLTNFYPESRKMTILGESLCQKVAKFHLFCHDFSKILLYFRIALDMRFS